MDLTRTSNPGGGVTLTIEGEVDFAVADELAKVGLECLAAAPGAPLRIGLSAVSFMDSSGVNALITLRRAAPDAVVLIAPSAQVTRVLQLTALDQSFVIEEAPVQ